MRVKICGITNAEDALLCESLGADALGFVHYPDRRRSLSIESIAEIASMLGPMLTKVLVCAPTTADEAIDIGVRAGVDAIQLYSLTADDILKIKNQGFKVIRAVGPMGQDARMFFDVADAILFDSRNPGTGQTYDYSSISINGLKRFIIAGGLTIDNLHLAKALNPYALDVSSGVERIYGKKDPDLVAEFIRRCKL